MSVCARCAEEIPAGSGRPLMVSPSETVVNRLTATYVVEIVAVKGRWVTIRVNGREYRLHEGDSFNFDLSVSS